MARGDTKKTDTVRYQQWLNSGLRKRGKTKSGLAQALGTGAWVVTKMTKGERPLRAHELLVAAEYLEEPHPDLGRLPDIRDNDDSTPFDEQIAKLKAKLDLIMDLRNDFLSSRKK